MNRRGFLGVGLATVVAGITQIVTGGLLKSGGTAEIEVPVVGDEATLKTSLRPDRFTNLIVVYKDQKLTLIVEPVGSVDVDYIATIQKRGK